VVREKPVKDLMAIADFFEWGGEGGYRDIM
jgi:hypothetical protein